MKQALSLLLLFSNTLLGQVNLNQGLVAYYPFSGNANDASGNNNNPVFNNATLTADRLGNLNNAYHFNGTSTYMQVPNSPTLNMGNQMSIALWAKPLGFYTGTCYNNMMVMKGDADYLPGDYFIRFSDFYTGCTAPTTTQERFYAPDVVAPNPIVQLNQWYSVVWTTDGTSAKLYVNCVLQQSSPAASFPFSNAYDLFIGRLNDLLYPYWLNGDLDEIRIYNRPLNQDEVNAYGGCAAASSIINDYTPVLAFDPCNNKLTVEDASAFSSGDTVLLIQMKGAVIDSSNTSSFGAVVDYKNSGNYEFNYVKSITGNIIELKNKLIRSYDVPNGKVQLIRVPFYQNFTVNSTLTCLPWDGSKGGVVVLNVQDSVILNTNIDVTGKGFKGGVGFNSNATALDCFQNNYTYPIANNFDAGQKGESIAVISQNIICGKGSPAGGGGGGLGHNSGGGGGANGGGGGFGGYQLEPCGNAPYDNRGIGGHGMSYNTAANKIFMGSGGGAGHADNAGNTPPGGGNGAGIILILCNYLKSNGNRIVANGDEGVTCMMPPSPDCHDGMGGGGAGGSVAISVNQILDNTVVENKGGKGADMIGSVPIGGRIGGGGGGGGGLLFLKGGSIPANLSNVNIGGVNGVLTTDNNNPWGATPGSNGTALFNLQIPFDIVPFKPNIDSVRINDSVSNCHNFDFNGLASTNSDPISTWQWFFGDGATATTQNTSHLFPSGLYAVKLVATDINGCVDSASKAISASTLTINAGPDTTVCNAASVMLQASNNGGTQFAWTPAQYLDDSSLLNPTATPTTSTTFVLTAINPQGCLMSDSVTVSVRSMNIFAIDPPSSICANESVVLHANGGDIYDWLGNNQYTSNISVSPQSTTTYSVQITDTICKNTSTLSTTVTVLTLPTVRASKSNDLDCSTDFSQLNVTGASNYVWSPTNTLSNALIANPVARPTTQTLYVVKGTDANGCVNYDSVMVNITGLNKGGYFMPSAFTPNNDGKNDCYRIKYWGVIEELDFGIYNRWGERIFHTTNPSDCWDGTYKGEKQNPGVYVYLITAKTSCGKVFKKGTFVLIR